AAAGAGARPAPPRRTGADRVLPHRLRDRTLHLGAAVRRARRTAVGRGWAAHPAAGLRGLARGPPLLAGRASGADLAIAPQRLRRGGRPGLVSALFGAVGHAGLLGVRLHGRPVVRARPADRALRRRSASVPDGAAAPARTVAALPGAARDLP